jgi:hypothetical protein
MPVETCWLTPVLLLLLLVVVVVVLLLLLLVLVLVPATVATPFTGFRPAAKPQGPCRVHPGEGVDQAAAGPPLRDPQDGGSKKRLKTSHSTAPVWPPGGGIEERSGRYCSASSLASHARGLWATQGSRHEVCHTSCNMSCNMSWVLSMIMCISHCVVA